MSVKQIPLLLLGGMFLGLLVLGVFYFFKSVDILDSSQSLLGSNTQNSFFQKSEVDALKVISAKNGLRKVWVYLFSTDKFNQTSNFGYTSPVVRETARSDIATYAMEELLRGPSPQETENGLQTIFGEDEFVTITGDSSCGGKDFVVGLNIRDEVAQVHFCRNLSFLGDASTQILREMIHKTLTQFESIQKVRIFNNKNNCFDGTIASTPEDCEY